MRALIQLLTAQPRAGKTQAALSLAGERAVLFVPSTQNANPKVTAIDWIWMRDLVALKPEQLRELMKRHPKLRVVLQIGEAELLRKLMPPEIAVELDGFTFIFDDLPVLLPYRRDQQLFAEFSAGVRHRGGAVIATTQFIRGVATPLMRAVTDKIDQVGPLVAEDEAKILYQMGASARYRNFREFYAALLNNPQYKLLAIKEA